MDLTIGAEDQASGGCWKRKNHVNPTSFQIKTLHYEKSTMYSIA